jgi:hypothetical protein
MFATVGDDSETLSAHSSTYSSALQNGLLITLSSTIYVSPLIERQDKLTLLHSVKRADEVYTRVRLTD